MKRTAILMFLFSLIAAGIGAEPAVLTLESSIASALECNLDFQIARINLDTAGREVDNSWNAFLPSVTASAGLNGSTSTTESDPMDWSVTGQVSLSLPLSSGLSASLDSIKLAYESELITYDTARLSLINEVEEDFYSLLAAQANIEIEKTNLELAEKRFDQANRNFQNGLVTELSVLQSKVAAANIKPTYLEAVSNYEIALREFLSAIGMDPETEAVLDGDLSVSTVELDRDVIMDTYIMNRRDVLAQQKQVEILENSRKATVRDSYLPSLSLSSQWGTTVSDALEADSWSSDTLSDSLSVGVTLTIPLDDYVPGSSTDTAVKALDDEIKSARLTLEATINDARTEIINLVAQLETAAAKIELSALNVELTRSTYEKSEDSFAQGGMEQLDLEDAQQDYFSAEQDYLESQLDYLNGLIDLRYALGLESLDELTK